MNNKIGINVSASDFFVAAWLLMQRQCFYFKICLSLDLYDLLVSSELFDYELVHSCQVSCDPCSNQLVSARRDNIIFSK